MLSFTGNLRVLAAVEPCDMRVGFNTLQGAVLRVYHLLSQRSMQVMIVSHARLPGRGCARRSQGPRTTTFLRSRLRDENRKDCNLL